MRLSALERATIMVGVNLNSKQFTFCEGAIQIVKDSCQTPKEATTIRGSFYESFSRRGSCILDDRYLINLSNYQSQSRNNFFWLMVTQRKIMMQNRALPPSFHICLIIYKCVFSIAHMIN